LVGEVVPVGEEQDSGTAGGIYSAFPF